MARKKGEMSRKEELVETAAELFYENGYHATGIQQIIAAAGIAKGTFYSHFKSKEELGVAWLRQRHHLWNGWRDAYLEEHARTPYEKILCLFDYIKGWMDRANCRGCAFLNTMAEIPDFDSPLRKEVRLHKQELLEFIRGLVDAHLKDTGSEKRQQIARTLFLLMESAIVEYQNFQEEWIIVSAKKAARQTLSWR